MRGSLAAASILLLGCQAQQAQQDRAPRHSALPDHHVHLSAEGTLRAGDAGEVLSAATLRDWRAKAIHVHYETGTTYRALLEHIIAPAIEAESTSLVLHAPGGDRETPLHMVYVSPSMHVSFATLKIRGSGLSLERRSFEDDGACLEGIRALRKDWRGTGTLAIQLDVPRTNEELSLEALQRTASLVSDGGCRPVLNAGDCGYAIERKRFEHAMAAKTVDERLRRLKAHVEAYPKPPRVSTAYSPFAWEWEGEIYVGDEWTEWRHVRTGETVEPKFDRPGGQDEKSD